MKKGDKEDILEAVNFGFQHAQTEMSEMKTDIKDLHHKVDNLTTSVEGLAKRHNNLDEAIVMERAARERLKEQVDKLCK